MKNKYILLFLLSLCSIFAVNAAELTIYNRLSKPVTVDVVWFNSWQRKDISKEYTIASNNSIHVSTGGAYPFKKLVWHDYLGPDVTGMYQANIATYNINIPSSAMMINGQIEIGADGQYSINFDQNGASEKKFTVRVVLPEKPLHVK